MGSNRQAWRTDNRPHRRVQVAWPSASQLLGQLVVLIIVTGLWAALLVAFVGLTGGDEPEAQARDSQDVPAVAAVTPTPIPPTATLPPTATATFTPTPLPPKVTATQPATAESLAVSPTVEPPTVIPSPSAAPTETETPLPTETSTATPEPTDEPAPSEGQAGVVSFKNEVLPILERRCIKCHGGEKTEEGLVLKTQADIMKGSYNGPVVEPGDVENSYLVEQVVEGEMPKKGPHLLPAEIRAIIAWVEAGAPDN